MQLTPLTLFATSLLFFTLTTDSFAKLPQFGQANAPARSTRPLTNADIIQMTDEEMAENSILKAIEASENQFDTSPAAVIQLHDAGVSLRVIEAMQKARNGKNSSQQQTTVDGLPAVVLPPPPIQQAASFTFALDGCNATGTTVTCYFTITNDGDERKLFIYAYGSKLTDRDGRNVIGRLVSLNDVEGTNTNTIAFSNNRIKGWLRFMNVPATALKSPTISLHFYASPPGSFDVRFNDVRLEGASEAPLDFPPIDKAKPGNRTGSKSKSKSQQAEDAVRSGRRIVDTIRGRRP